MTNARPHAKRSDGAGSYWYSTTEDRWRARFLDAAGRQRHLSARTEEDIIRKLEGELSKLNQGLLGLTPTQTPTVSEWMDLWMASKPDLTEKSRERHGTDIRLYIKPHLGRIRLDKLSPLQVEHFYGELATKPTARRPEGLSSASIRRVHAVLAAALADAYRLGVMQAAIMHRVKAPRVGVTPKAILSVAEVEQLLLAAAGVSLACKVRWSMAAKWGLRQGEALGMRWSDVDLATGRIDVLRQVQRQRSKGLIMKGPKANSFRNLFVDSDTLADLKALRATVSAQQVGSTTGDDRPVFPNSRGGLIDPMNDQHAFKRLLAKAQVRNVGVHALRHTAITRMIESGIPLPVVKEIAGHSDIHTTMQYVHLADSPAKVDAAVLVQGTYGPTSPATPLRPTDEDGLAS